MSDSGVTTEGISHPRPGREATADYRTPRRRRRGEQAMVPDADFRSYYGMPVLNKPVWKPADIAGYLFLGGLAGASSVTAAVADLRGEHELARAAKVGAAGAATLSLAALVHDLGRPERFLNMLRVVKLTSPMSVGSWLLSAYSPATLVAAGSCVTGRWRPLGAVATAGAAGLGPLVASYTSTLISNTAVPAWHEAYREMPGLFVGSAAMAAGGLGLATAPPDQQRVPRRIALLGAATELAAGRLMEHRLGQVAEPYQQGRSGRLVRLGQGLALAGAGAAVAGRRGRVASTVAGGLLLVASACTRLGIFQAGVASANNPGHTVQPQRERVQQQGSRKTSR